MPRGGNKKEANKYGGEKKVKAERQPWPFISLFVCVFCKDALLPEYACECLHCVCALVLSI